jgi:hypothetical protein
LIALSRVAFEIVDVFLLEDLSRRPFNQNGGNLAVRQNVDFHIDPLGVLDPLYGSMNGFAFRFLLG